MQTFLPYPEFDSSAACLDRQRLGKQRPEVIQLLEALDDPLDRNHKHPACIMWWGFRDALVAYGLAICQEWESRGYEDAGARAKIYSNRTVPHTPTQCSVACPKWIGEQAFHASHRSNLLRKDREWYSAYGWQELANLPYVWPVNHDRRLFRF